MREYIRVCGVILLVVLFGTSYVYRKAYTRERVERKRVEQNQEALLNDMEYYKANNGELVATNEVLRLNIDEFKTGRAELVKELKNLQIRLKDANSVSQTITQTDYTIKTPVRDTVIIRDTIRAALAFNWADGWATIKGVVDADSAAISYKSRDTLLQVVHIERKRFLFFRWGVKSLRQSVKTSNPNTTIIYTEAIELK